MWGKRLWLFPVAVFVCIPMTFFISYAIAVSNRHVSPGFPFISDTGTYPPESCIFGQLLNISSVLAGITLYIRFRDIEECLLRREITHMSCVRLSRVNIAGLILGMISAFGASLVANFQETNVIEVHLVGALMCFGVGAVYCWLQTYITYKLCGSSSLRVAHLRLFVCVIITIFFILLFISEPIAKSKFKGGDNKHWSPDQGGYAEHLVSTISEWIIAIAMMVYFLTFVKEFRDFGLRKPLYYRHSDNVVGPANCPDYHQEKNGPDQREVTLNDSSQLSPEDARSQSNGSSSHIMVL